MAKLEIIDSNKTFGLASGLSITPFPYYQEVTSDGVGESEVILSKCTKF